MVEWLASFDSEATSFGFSDFIVAEPLVTEEAPEPSLI